MLCGVVLISEFCVLRTPGLESFEITSGIVSGALFPASKQDADPLKSGVMALTVKAFLCNKEPWPRDRSGCYFSKRSAAKAVEVSLSSHCNARGK